MQTLSQRKDTNGRTGMIVKRVSVPIGLEELMEGLSKEVILKKPKDMYVFASEYFARLVNLREQSKKYKAHPVHSIQSATQLKTVSIPPLKKILPPRPTKHLSRQLSIRNKSPVHRPTQTESVTRRNITSKSKERKTSLDRKHSNTEGVLKNATSRELLKISNGKSGTSTGTSSVQSTPREKRQSSVGRKVKSSVSDDQITARKENKKNQKTQKRSQSENVKTALILPTVIGGTDVVAKDAVVDMNVPKQDEKSRILESKVLGDSTNIFLVTNKTDNSDAQKSKDEQAQKVTGIDNQPDIVLQESSVNSHDSDVLAQSTNIEEISKSKEENLENLKKTTSMQKDDNTEISHVNYFTTKAGKLEEETITDKNDDQEKNGNYFSKRSPEEPLDSDILAQATNVVSENHQTEENNAEKNQNIILPITVLNTEELSDTDLSKIEEKETIGDEKDKNRKDKNNQNQTVNATETLVNSSGLTFENLMDVHSSGERNMLKLDTTTKDTISDSLPNIMDKDKIHKDEIDSLSRNRGEIDVNDLTTDEKLYVENDGNILEPTNKQIQLNLDQAKDLNLVEKDQISANEKLGISDITIHEKSQQIQGDEKLSLENKSNPDPIAEIGEAHSSNTVETDNSVTEQTPNVEKIVTPDKSSSGDLDKVAREEENSTENNEIKNKPSDKIMKEAKPINSQDKNMTSNKSKAETSPTGDSMMGAHEKESILITNIQAANPEEQDAPQHIEHLSVETLRQPIDLLTNGEENSSNMSESEDQIKEKKDNVSEFDDKYQANTSKVNEDAGGTINKDNSVGITGLTTKEDIKGNTVTITMENMGKSDDVLTVSISDNVNKEHKGKQGTKNEFDNNALESIENISTTTTNDTNQERNQFFRENEKLVSNQDNNSEIISEPLMDVQGHDSIKHADVPSDTSSQVCDENVYNVPDKDNALISKLSTAHTEDVNDINRKFNEESTLPFLSSEKGDVNNLTTSESNAKTNNDVTQNIIDYKISNSQSGRIDSPVKHFLNSFINNEQFNVFKNNETVDADKGIHLEVISSKNEPEEYSSEVKDANFNGDKEIKDKSDRILNDTALTEEVKVYTGNPLTFNSVKDILDFDSKNVNLDNAKKIEESVLKSQHPEITPVLEHETRSEIFDQTQSPRRKRSIIEDKETREDFDNKQPSDTPDTEPTEQPDTLNKENIDLEKKVKETLTVQKSGSLQIDEQVKAQLGSVGTDHKMELISEKNSTETNTYVVLNDSKIPENVPGITASGKEESTILKSTFDQESQDKLKHISDGQDKELAIDTENIPGITKRPISVDKDDAANLINNVKAADLGLVDLVEIKSSAEDLPNVKHLSTETEVDNVSNIQHIENILKPTIDAADTSKGSDGTTKIFKDESKGGPDNIHREKEDATIISINPLKTPSNAEFTSPNINNFKSSKESPVKSELKITELAQIASAIEIIQNIMSSKISVHKPGLVDTSVRQFLNSFLSNEQRNVFQNKPTVQNKSTNQKRHKNNDSKKETSVENKKELLSDRGKPKSTETKHIKHKVDKPLLNKKERSRSQENVLSNENKLLESASKTAGMRRVRSVGQFKHGENEVKSKIPTSARRSAGRRPLVRQLETDSRDIEEKLNNKKEISTDLGTASDESNQDNHKKVSKNSKDITEKIEETYEEAKNKEIKDQHEDGIQETLIKKDMNKKVYKENVTKEDVLIAKTILKGIEGAEKHIELMEGESTNKANNILETHGENDIKSSKETSKEIGGKDTKHQEEVSSDINSASDAVGKSGKEEHILDVSQHDGSVSRKDYENKLEMSIKPDELEATKEPKESTLKDSANKEVLAETMLAKSNDIDQENKANNDLATTSSFASFDKEEDHNIDSKELRPISAREIRDTTGISAVTDKVQELETEDTSIGKILDPIKHFEKVNTDQAATAIQKTWRGFHVRDGLGQKPEDNGNNANITGEKDYNVDSKGPISEVAVSEIRDTASISALSDKVKELEKEDTTTAEILDPIKHFEKVDTDQAATTIQKTWRGFHVRKDLGQKPKDNKDQPKLMGERDNDVAPKELSPISGVDVSEIRNTTAISNVTNKVQELEKEGTSIDEVLDPIKHSEKVKSNQAATTIQKTWRGFQVRKDLGQTAEHNGHELKLTGEQEKATMHKELKEEENAAVQIQSHWRGYVTRKMIKKLNIHNATQEKAIIKIQAVVRGYLEKLKYEKLKNQNTTKINKADNKISHDEKADNTIIQNQNFIKISDKIFNENKSEEDLRDHKVDNVDIPSKENQNSEENLMEDENSADSNDGSMEETKQNEKDDAFMKKQSDNVLLEASVSKNIDKENLTNHKENKNGNNLERTVSNDKDDTEVINDLFKTGNKSPDNYDANDNKVATGKLDQQHEDRNKDKEVEEISNEIENKNISDDMEKDINIVKDKENIGNDIVHEHLNDTAKISDGDSNNYFDLAADKSHEDKISHDEGLENYGGRIDGKHLEKTLGSDDITQTGLEDLEVKDSDHIFDKKEKNPDKEEDSYNLKNTEDKNHNIVILVGSTPSEELRLSKKTEGSIKVRNDETYLEKTLNEEKSNKNGLSDKHSNETENKQNDNSIELIDSQESLVDKITSVNDPKQFKETTKEMSEETNLLEEVNANKENIKEDEYFDDKDDIKPIKDTVKLKNISYDKLENIANDEELEKSLNNNIEKLADQDENETGKDEKIVEKGIEYAVSKENSNTIITDDLNKQLESSISKEELKLLPSEEVKKGLEESLNENIKGEILVDLKKNVDNDSDNIKIKSREKASIEPTGTEENLNNDVKTSDHEYNKDVLEYTSKDGKNNKELDFTNTLSLDETTNVNKDDFNQENTMTDNITSKNVLHEPINHKNLKNVLETSDNEIRNKDRVTDSDINDSSESNSRDKPDFYRSNTVLEPEIVKKAVSHLGDDDAKENNTEIQNNNVDDPVLRDKDDNNNTQSKEETELESEVRSTVNKILKDDKNTSSLEIEIEEAVKNIMDNNIDGNKLTSWVKPENHSDIQKDEVNKTQEHTIVDVPSQVPSHDPPENVNEQKDKYLQSNSSEQNISLDKTIIRDDQADQHEIEQNMLKNGSLTKNVQPDDQSTKNKDSLILSVAPSTITALSEKVLKNYKDQSNSEINVDDVSSVDSVDSVITVVPNENYDVTNKGEHVTGDNNKSLPNRSLSHDITKDRESKEVSNKDIVKKSLSTDAALEGHVELIDHVQNTLLDQICGKPVDIASKFNIEQLRKELHEAASLYNGQNEEHHFATHDDELLEYLNDFEPEDDNAYDSKIIRTPIRELPDIEEEVDSSADDAETTRKGLEKKTDQKMQTFCKTPTTAVEKLIDNKPLNDHVEVINLEKLKQGHNEIVINNENIKINGTENDDVDNQIVDNQKLLHSSELHDSLVLPMSASSVTRSTLVNSGKLKHTSEFHDTLVVPLPSGSDVNIKNEAKDMLGKEDKPEPTRTESVDTGNQTAFQQSSAGAPVVTSRRSSHDGDVDVEAQASLRDTSPTRPKSVESFTHQSPPQTPRFVKQDMESENNNNKRNNAITNQVSVPGKNMEAEAATKIQAGFRGFQVRKQMRNKNATSDKSNQERQLRRKSSGRKNPKESDLAEKSAVKIQAGVRGFLVRRRQKKQLNSSASA